jgi:ABC-2 type transport system permease protein
MNTSPVASALALKSRRQFANTWRILREQSRFKVWFVTFFAILCETGLLLLFLDAFKFLDTMGGVGIMIIDRLFALFFFGTGLMLVTSGIVTSYATIYRSDEIPFMITRPFDISEIVSYKFLESTWLSSWAFSFIIIPFIGAYAWHENTTVLLAFWTFLFSIPFLVICSGLGTIVTMLFVRWFPGVRFMKVCGVILLVALGAAAYGLSREAYNFSTEFQMNLSRLIPGLNLASCALLPSWCVSEGIMAMSHHEWFRGLMLWGVVLSTAMMIHVTIQWIGELTFYEGWQRIIGSGGFQRRAPLLFPQLDRGLAVLPGDIRALIMKDIRTFLRDPMQWSQVLIFFGLLGLYFVNLRSFHYQTLPDNWRNTIAFLNVFSVSAVMCSLSSRFVYPQLSLEGQGFWIIGLSPVTMKRVLLTKFMLALCGMLVISVGLMLLSCGMLKAAPITMIMAVLVACAMSFAVSGLSTGLGTIFIDLSQRNPVAIVSGFGGTLNLVLSLAFMLGAILPFSLVFHFHTVHRFSHSQLLHGLLISGTWLLVITAAATIIPLWLGLRYLARKEF